MKVILVNGSPHKEGCTYTALSEVSKTLNKEGIETEIFNLCGGDILPCRACGACAKLGKCIKADRPIPEGCDSPERICVNYLVSGRQRVKDRVKVVICNESLGY